MGDCILTHFSQCCHNIVLSLPPILSLQVVYAPCGFEDVCQPLMAEFVSTVFPGTMTLTLTSILWWWQWVVAVGGVVRGAWWMGCVVGGGWWLVVVPLAQ